MLEIFTYCFGFNYRLFIPWEGEDWRLIRMWKKRKKRRRVRERGKV